MTTQLSLIESFSLQNMGLKCSFLYSCLAISSCLCEEVWQAKTLSPNTQSYCMQNSCLDPNAPSISVWVRHLSDSVGLVPSTFFFPLPHMHAHTHTCAYVARKLCCQWYLKVTLRNINLQQWLLKVRWTTEQTTEQWSKEKWHLSFSTSVQTYHIEGLQHTVLAWRGVLCKYIIKGVEKRHLKNNTSI